MIAIALVGCQSFVPAFVKTKPDYSEVPTEALRDLALSIEKAVQAGDTSYIPENTGGLVIDTRELKQAVRTRAARSGLVNKFLDAGFGWERQNGHLYIIRDKAYRQATTGKERSRNALMVSGEWDNRWLLYEGLRKESNLPPKALSAIQETFHKARLECMKKGQKYESESGDAAAKS